jgi:hypothetical protein
MAAFPLACPQKHKIRNNNNKNNEKNVCPWVKIQKCISPAGQK